MIQPDHPPRRRREPIPELTGLGDGQVAGFVVAQTAILGCRVGTDLFAFADRCGRCQESLAGASLGRVLGGGIGEAALGCPRCGAHFQVRRAGVCLESTELHLDPLPLLVNDGVASVAVPASAAA